VTLPCVLQIALIRQSILRKQKRSNLRLLVVIALAVVCILVNMK
jgi:hypothetical protein